MTCFFFFNDTATTEIYTLSLHDALPILKVGDARTLLDVSGGYTRGHEVVGPRELPQSQDLMHPGVAAGQDRERTRLNSSHLVISYAHFCLKKKNTILMLSIGAHHRHIPA